MSAVLLVLAYAGLLFAAVMAGLALRRWRQHDRRRWR